ncbi:hypothetical protein PM033_17500 [Halorubrum ezzemoulense]|uniref:hypothetical protein n=1 Tax=Halorubrum ezzemoulense TaxID=337243 RepID=UPI00232FA2D0|nr:hypothetical protein [Halorubrum ezzemoulense]MDB2253519.1 hypothetical protein [Halorubrum ezzemoulense]
MDRRRYLAGAGATLGTVLAGCSGSTEGEGGSEPPVESGEVGAGSADHYVEIESGDTLRVEITNEDTGRTSRVEIVNPDNDTIIEEDVEDETTITHEAESTGDYRVIIYSAGTASYEIYVE